MSTSYLTVCIHKLAFPLPSLLLPGWRWGESLPIRDVDLAPHRGAQSPRVEAWSVLGAWERLQPASGAGGHSHLCVTGGEAECQSRYQSIQRLSARGAPPRPNLGPQGRSTLICCWSSSKVLLGGSLGVWFGSWKCVCLDVFSSRPPISIREKHPACCGGGASSPLCLDQGGGLAHISRCAIVQWALFSWPSRRV